MTTVIYRNSHRVKQADAVQSRGIWSLPSVSMLEAELTGMLAQFSSRRFEVSWDARSRSRDAGEVMRLTLNIGGEHVPVYLADPSWRFDWPEHWAKACTVMQQGQLWQLRGSRVRQALESAVGLNIAVSGASIEAVPDGWMKLRVRCGSLHLPCWCEAESLVRALSGTGMPRSRGLRDLALLRTRCHLMLRPISIPAISYAALERGDVLLLDVEGDLTLRGMLSPTGFGAVRAVRFDRQGTIMVDGNFVTTDEAGTLSIVDGHTVSLVVELGACEMSLGALANLSHGECIRLDKSLNDLTVRVTYQGQRIATGQLIDISGLVGVRLEHVYLGGDT
ncbi:FliM/FliN family flagellar motor C-terminal domain-containing protein [Burkholderia pyrrocinia]